MSSKLFKPDTYNPKRFTWLNPDCTIVSTGTVTLDLDFGQSHHMQMTFHVLPDTDLNIIGITDMAYFNIMLDTKNKHVIFGNDFDDTRTGFQPGYTAPNEDSGIINLRALITMTLMSI